MKKFMLMIVYIGVGHSAYVCSCCSKHESCNKEKVQLVEERCDSCGYYFDRGGRRMFETSFDSYKRGTFNLRRGHMWQDQTCRHRKCKHVHKLRHELCQASENDVKHVHYSGQKGLMHWPSSNGPDNGRAGTKGYPYVETPIWLRDTSGPNAYATPTSWQGFQ